MQKVIALAIIVIACVALTACEAMAGRGFVNTTQWSSKDEAPKQKSPVVNETNFIPQPEPLISSNETEGDVYKEAPVEDFLSNEPPLLDTNESYTDTYAPLGTTTGNLY